MALIWQERGNNHDREYIHICDCCGDEYPADDSDEAEFICDKCIDEGKADIKALIERLMRKYGEDNLFLIGELFDEVMEEI